MDIKSIEKLFKGRFKFSLTTNNIHTYDAIITFKDTTDGMVYKIEMSTAVSLETILENIIKDKRDNKLKNVLNEKD